MAQTRIFRKLGLLRLSSPVIVEGDPIPARYTAKGGNLSPPLSWSEGRAGTASTVITCEDLRGLHGSPFTLWILFNIPASLREVPEGISKVPLPPEVPNASQGINDTGSIGYDGPAPPLHHPAHRYLFQVCSLDTKLELPPGINRSVLQAAMEGHILEVGTLLGTFSR
jgi:Raf kinase inhibitor-like YbhB/YbcL family protein